MGNIQAGDKQSKTGKSPAKSKNFIRNLNRKSPARDSKKSKKGEGKHAVNEKPLDKTPDSDHIGAASLITAADNDAIENVFKTVERECNREAADVSAAAAEAAAAGEAEPQVTGPTCLPRPSCLAARSTNREQTPEDCGDEHHGDSREPPGPRRGDNAAHRSSVDRVSDNSDNKRKHTPTKDSSSDSVFTDPLTPVAFSAELNQCYYSAESDSTLGEPRAGRCHASDRSEDAELHVTAMPLHALDRRQSPNKNEEKKDPDVIGDSSFAEDDDEKVMGSLLASPAPCKDGRGADGDEGQHECSHDFAENRLKASTAQTSFTLSRHRRVELPPTKLNDACLVERSDASDKEHRRHSSLNEPAGGSGGGGAESNVLRKVASLTLEQAVEPRPAARPKFVPEKLHFHLYEKFEGQMLVNWFASSMTENSHMKSLPSVPDLRALGVQYCTHLLAAGVLRQIEDGDTPADSVFRPDMMYYWAHTEAPTAQPVTPGRIQMLKWPPTYETTPTSKSTDDEIKGSKHDQILKNDNKYCELYDAKKPDEPTSNIDEAKQIIFQLTKKCEMLQVELEKYKTLSQIQSLTQNAQDDFYSPHKSEQGKRFFSQEEKPPRSKQSPTTHYTEEPLNNKFTNETVINIPDLISDKIDVKKCVQPIVVSSDSFKHDNSIIKSKSVSEYPTQLSRLYQNESDEIRSEEIENFCKLNKSREKISLDTGGCTRELVDAKECDRVTENKSEELHKINGLQKATIVTDTLSNCNVNYNSMIKVPNILSSLRTCESLELSKHVSDTNIVDECAPHQEIKLEKIMTTQNKEPTDLIRKQETLTPKDRILKSADKSLLPQKAPEMENRETTFIPVEAHVLEVKPLPPTTNIDPMTSTRSPPLSIAPPPPPPMPNMEPLQPFLPTTATMSGIGPPPPPMPSTGLMSTTTTEMETPNPMPGMGPPPPPMPSAGLMSSTISGMGPPPPPPPPMPGMGPPPPPMPGMGPPPPPMPGMGPPPPPMPGPGGPPPPPMPGLGSSTAINTLGIPPPPMPGANNCNPVPPTGVGPPPPPMSGPVPFPAPPVGGWNPQRATLRKTPVVPSVPMKPLYWTRILAPQQQPIPVEPVPAAVKPLWMEIEEDSLDNIDEFADLFSRQVITKKPVKKKVETKTKIQPVKILDSKRSQNVGILAQSLHVEFSEIENAIYNFDTSVVSLEALHQIYELRATDEELSLIKEHLKKKSEIPLDKPETFLHDLSGIPNFAERISCFMFQAEFEDSISTIMHKLDNLKHTCEFLMSNEDLKKLFAIILTLGNYMNGGNGQRGQADGFGLEILSKLRDVKSKESTVTLLHFIVRTYMRRRGGPLAEECGLPVPEPGDVARAAAIDFTDAHAHLSHLAKQLQDCREKMKKVVDTEEEIQSQNESFDDSMKKRYAVFKDKMKNFLEVADEKLKTENENLEECRNKFIITVRFYQYNPRSGKIDDCEPKDFFALWLSFCTDFKDIFKKEQQFALKEKLKETKKRKEEIRATAQPKKEGGLKARMQRLAKK